MGNDDDKKRWETYCPTVEISPGREIAVPVLECSLEPCPAPPSILRVSRKTGLIDNGPIDQRLQRDDARGSPPCIIRVNTLRVTY